MLELMGMDDVIAGGEKESTEEREGDCGLMVGLKRGGPG